MAKLTRERYRLSISRNGGLFKALSHSVEEDESLFVMNRSPMRPRHIASGSPKLTEEGLTIVDLGSGTLAHQVHYHPSGAILVKAPDNRTVRRLQAPPMLMLSAPFLMFHLSLAA